MTLRYRLTWFIWSCISEISGQREGSWLYRIEMWMEQWLDRQHPVLTDKERERIVMGVRWL